MESPKKFNLPKDPPTSWERVMVSGLDYSTKQRIYEIYNKAYSNASEYTIDTMFDNITQVVLLTEGVNIVGCASLSFNRVLWIGIDVDFAGQGYGKSLFKSIKGAIPNAWISIGVKHPKVIATAIKTGYRVVRDIDEVKALFESIGKKKNPAYSSQIDPSLTDLTNSNLSDTPLLGFSKIPEETNKKSGFNRGNDYIQIVLSAN